MITREEIVRRPDITPADRDGAERHLNEMGGDAARTVLIGRPALANIIEVAADLLVRRAVEEFAHDVPLERSVSRTIGALAGFVDLLDRAHSRQEGEL